MKRIFSILALVSCLAFPASAQTILRDAQGNYQSVRAKKDTSLTPEIFIDANGNRHLVYFTDPKGNKWPVYKTSTGRIYALRTSKNGKQYKQYLNKPVLTQVN